MFKVGDRFILFDWKELCRTFCLVWNFVSFRNGLKITCNRIDRKISYNSCGIVKFAIEYDDCANINPVIMTATCGIHSNTCDPFCVEQCVLV